MTIWYQVWFPPHGDRTEVKLFGIRATNGIIDIVPGSMNALRGLILENVKISYESRGAIISKISEVWS